jgi:predicted AlkP superfamily phosphohydrolase/phosphomutase
MENGIWGTLESTIPPITGPAWTSFSTGKNPGKHGVFSFIKVENGSLKLNRSKDVKSNPIYEILSNKGLQSIIISLPLSFPPNADFKGIMVSDSLYPGKDIFPESKRIYIKDYKTIPDFSKEGEELLEELIDTAKRRVQMAKELFLKEKWDFYFFWFGESDSVSHFFWNNIRCKTKTGKAKNIFDIVDDFLKWILEKMNDKTILIVMSDHGFTDYRYKVNLNKLFKDHGLLKIKIKKRTEDETLENHIRNQLEVENKKIKTRSVYIPHLVFKVAKHPIVLPLSKKFFRLFFGKSSETMNVERVDFNRSKAFVPTSESLGVYLNKSSEDKKLLNDIREMLESMEFDGQKVFRKVYLKTEVYSGPYLDLAPDILLLPNGFYVTSSFKGELFDMFEHRGWHSLDGILLVYGPSIKKAARIENAKIYDIAPTILYIFNLPIPNDIDGRVLSEIFEPGSKLAKGEPVYVDASYYIRSENEKIKTKIKELKLKGKV